MLGAAAVLPRGLSFELREHRGEAAGIAKHLVRGLRLGNLVVLAKLRSRTPDEPSGQSSFELAYSVGNSHCRGHAIS